jgi:hypothetical protein
MKWLWALLVCKDLRAVIHVLLHPADYVRTYTLDKKLETWVKESGFLGGAGKGEPTVVTPKLYRQRFVSAMERYFPLVLAPYPTECANLTVSLGSR